MIHANETPAPSSLSVYFVIIGNARAIVDPDNPGRKLYEKAYYISPRIHPTAAMVLALGMGRPTLRIQGAHQKPHS